MKPSGRLSQKHQRQVVRSAIAPPMNGPTIAATPKTADITPKYVARRSSGITMVVTIMEPEKIPAAPSPATARPEIKAAEFELTAQMREPSSKMLMAAR